MTTLAVSGITLQQALAMHLERLTLLWSAYLDYAADKRIARGIRLLYAEVPDWRGRIAFERLDIGCSATCMLGQLFGTYSQGLDHLGLSGGVRHGFQRSPLISYNRLNRAWIRAMKGPINVRL